MENEAEKPEGELSPIESEILWSDEKFERVRRMEEKLFPTTDIELQWVKKAEEEARREMALITNPDWFLERGEQFQYPVRFN